MRSERFLLVVVFLAGIGTLGVEMVMPRLLAPYFGTSQPIWAVIIGMTLAYLAIGYQLGGRMADRYPDERVLFRLIALAGVLTAFIPPVAAPVLRGAQQALRALAGTQLVGAFVGVVLLFAAPVILLAMVGPFAVRLQLHRAAAGVAVAGRTSGTISALSTAGSILGTFLTVLVLIPTLGTALTIYLLAGLLVALAATGLRDWRVALLLLPVAGLAWWSDVSRASIKAADCRECTLLAEAESPINYIQVAAQAFAYQDPADPARTIPDPRVNLILNEGQAIHSSYRTHFRETGDPVDLLVDGGPWDYFIVAPYVVPERRPADIRSLAMLGSAAGTVPKQFLAVYGADRQVDAVEIDGRIVTLARQYFDLEDQDPAFPAYTTHIQDARAWLTALPPDARYDLIAMDAYQQPYVPFHLTTVEFFQEVRARLAPEGVVMVNAGRGPSGDDRLVNALAGTMRVVFPQVFVIETRRGGNSMLIGVGRPVGDGVAHFRANRQALGDEQRALGIVMDWALEGGRWGGMREFLPEEARYAPFTDDHAPVEQLIDALIVSEYLRR